MSIVVKLCSQTIPFVGKSVKDYLDNGGSNPLVKIATAGIRKLTDPIRKKVEKITKAATDKVEGGFPDVEPESKDFVGLRLVMKKKKVDVAASLPRKFA